MSWGQKWDVGASQASCHACCAVGKSTSCGSWVQVLRGSLLCEQGGRRLPHGTWQFDNATFLSPRRWSCPPTVTLGLTMWHALAKGKYKLDSNRHLKKEHAHFLFLSWTLSLTWGHARVSLWRDTRDTRGVIPAKGLPDQPAQANLIANFRTVSKPTWDQSGPAQTIRARLPTYNLARKNKWLFLSFIISN